MKEIIYAIFVIHEERPVEGFLYLDGIRFATQSTAGFIPMPLIDSVKLIKDNSKIEVITADNEKIIIETREGQFESQITKTSKAKEIYRFMDIMIRYMRTAKNDSGFITIISDEASKTKDSNYPDLEIYRDRIEAYINAEFRYVLDFSNIKTIEEKSRGYIINSDVMEKITDFIAMTDGEKKFMKYYFNKNKVKISK